MNRQERRRIQNEFKKIKNHNQKMNRIITLSSEYKQINFKDLHNMSLENYGYFNQNVWTEKVLQDFPQIGESNLVVQRIMIHKHFRGESVKPHYRTLIYNHIDGSQYIQDMSFEQWDNLKEIPIEIMMEIELNKLKMVG